MPHRSLEAKAQAAVHHVVIYLSDVAPLTWRTLVAATPTVPISVALDRDPAHPVLVGAIFFTCIVEMMTAVLRDLNSRKPRGFLDFLSRLVVIPAEMSLRLLGVPLALAVSVAIDKVGVAERWPGGAFWATGGTLLAIGTSILFREVTRSGANFAALGTVDERALDALQRLAQQAQQNVLANQRIITEINRVVSTPGVIAPGATAPPAMPSAVTLASSSALPDAPAGPGFSKGPEEGKTP